MVMVIEVGVPMMMMRVRYALAERLGKIEAKLIAQHWGSSANDAGLRRRDARKFASTDELETLLKEVAALPASMDSSSDASLQVTASVTHGDLEPTPTTPDVAARQLAASGGRNVFTLTWWDGHGTAEFMNGQYGAFVTVQANLQNGQHIERMMAQLIDRHTYPLTRRDRRTHAPLLNPISVGEAELQRQRNEAMRRSAWTGGLVGGVVGLASGILTHFVTGWAF